MSTQPIAGYEGAVSVQGTTLYLDSWTVTGTAGDIKTTNFESDGYAQRIGGIVEAKITAKGYWDGDNNPHDDPPGIMPGDVIGPFTLTVTSGTTYNFPLALVTEITASSQVDGRAEFEFTAMSSGEYTFAGIDGNS